MSVTDIIIKSNEISDENLTALSREVDTHPYYHAAAITLTLAHYNQQSALYGETIRRTAISIPDRSALFAFIEGRDYTLGTTSGRTPTLPMQSDTRDTDRTTSLIEHFLGTQPEEKPRRLTTADAASDYMAYLLQSEGESQDTNDSPMRGQSLIDEFIDNNQGERIILPDQQTATPDATVTGMETVNKENDEDISPEFFTETMARIYIKQGKFDKASKIIGRLNVKYPKKNRYFADQMRFLEKLMYNQRLLKQK